MKKFLLHPGVISVALHCVFAYASFTADPEHKNEVWYLVPLAYVSGAFLTMQLVVRRLRDGYVLNE